MNFFIRKTSLALIFLLSIFALSNLTLTANATQHNTLQTREVSDYTIEELDSIFSDFCKENNIDIIKGSSDFETYLRNFLLQETYPIDDGDQINLLRAYAAIYLNKDYLESHLSKNNTRVNSDGNNKLELQTIGDIKNITEQDNENSELLSITKPRAYTGYLPNVAVKYATNHVHSPNSNYADFTNIGGDCTNFVSQALYAGGIKQVSGSNLGQNGWFYNTSSQRSATWTGAHEFGNFWRSRVGVISKRYKSEIIQFASPGDVIQYKEYGTGLRYHSVMVTSKLSNDILIAQRTDNYLGSWTNRGGIPNHNGHETYFDLLNFGD